MKLYIKVVDLIVWAVVSTAVALAGMIIALYLEVALSALLQ